MEESCEGVNVSNRIEEVVEVLKAEIANAKETRTLPSVALLLVDIDNLERVNRWYGRNTGNAIIRDVAQILKGSLRSEDVLVRFGGDEFLILLRGAGLNEAKDKARGILEAIKRYNIVSKELRISVSIGIAHYFSFAFSADEFLGCAVEALTLAQKQNGTYKIFMEEEEWNAEQ